jgi:Pup amidohydrolase
MLTRLLGLETEYAIRFTPKGGRERHPGNDLIYGAISDAIRKLVTAQPGERGVDSGREQLFLQNGGALYYEFFPQALKGGLLEASTPECKGPSQLLLYQKAEEALLLRALPMAEDTLRMRGYDGEIGLLKNCRDAQGHVYGAQENFEVAIAGGLALLAFRIGLFVLLPIAILDFLLFWSVTLTIVVGIILMFTGSLVLGALYPRLRPRLRILRWVADDHADLSREIGWASLWMELVLCWPLVQPFALLLRAFAFRRSRVDLAAFLISRAVLTGAGTLEPDGSFWLSEKGPAIRRMIRSSASPSNRPIFDTGNLMKQMMLILYLRIAPLAALFSRRQRLQLGLSDSNLLETAEYLKIGTTALVVDMAELGLLRDAPRAADPIAALHAIVKDPTLATKVRVRTRQGTAEMTALEIQRWYYAQAKSFVEREGVVSLEAKEIIRLWGEALDALARDPSSLVGRLDWVTKRYLIETAGAGDRDAEKKIDLRYHEIGRGYVAKLIQGGAVSVLVAPEEVERAIVSPPEETPAKIRGRLIRELAASHDRVTVSWDSVRIGGRLRGSVIKLDDHRR